MRKRLDRLGVVVLVLALSSAAPAQERPEGTQLPDMPVAKQNGDASSPKPGKKIWREPIGILTRRSYFYPDLATSPGPLSSAEKFKLFLSQSVSPQQYLSSAAGAGLGQARNSLAGYGQEAGGYAKRFGSSMASGAASHFFGAFLLASLLHQDPRFFVKVDGGFGQRLGYALRRAAVTRTDAGYQAVNWPGMMGPLAAEGLANSYLPVAEQTPGRTFRRYGIRMGFGAANNILREYWPVIFKSLGIAKVAPGLRPQPSVAPPAPPGTSSKTP